MVLCRARLSLIAAILGKLAVSTAGTAAPVTDALLLGITSVEALHVAGQLLIGFADELRQSATREFAVLVVHRLDARAFNRQQLRPNRSSCRYRMKNSRNTFLKAERLIPRKLAILRKSGFRYRSSQIILMSLVASSLMALSAVSKTYERRVTISRSCMGIGSTAPKGFNPNIRTS